MMEIEYLWNELEVPMHLYHERFFVYRDEILIFYLIQGKGGCDTYMPWTYLMYVRR